VIQQARQGLIIQPIILQVLDFEIKILVR